MLQATGSHAAQLELARREYQRRHAAQRGALGLADWLPTVAPHLTWDWAHLRYIQAHLDRVTRGELMKLMIFCPPRHGKSVQTTIHYPIYRMERDPQTRIILGCYNQQLADYFSREARDLALKRKLLSPTKKNAQDEWYITGGGSFRAAGVGGGVTGLGANLLIIDDPIRSREDANSENYREKTWNWYRNDMYTRLEPGGAIIIILTRWHEDDLAGRILASEDGPNWTVIALPAEAEVNDPLGRAAGEALCPERYDLAALASIKLVLGMDYYALYQQHPVGAQGGVYQKLWFLHGLPPTTVRGDYLFDARLQVWDTASSQLGDWSCCLTAGIANNHVYVLDVWRGRVESPDLLTEVRDQAARWSPRVILIEDSSNGTAVIQMLKRETKLPILAVKPMREGKLAHAKANLPYLEGGRVTFCPGTYLVDFERELLSFPQGTYDDQVDSLNILLTRVFGGNPQRAGSHAGSQRGT